jgi:hypothetical protein
LPTNPPAVLAAESAAPASQPPPPLPSFLPNLLLRHVPIIFPILASPPESAALNNAPIPLKHTQVEELADFNAGYDAAADVFTDMVKSGIIDPLKVGAPCSPGEVLAAGSGCGFQG